MTSGIVFRLLLAGMLLSAFLETAHGESVILEEITVRGEKQQTNEENLTVREVRENPSRDIGEALQYVPGMTMVRKGAIANDIVLRGFQRDNLNMFLDGARLHGGCPSRMDPPSFHFDFAEVESIEIIKGPYDLKNPGGMAGTVNAVSKKPKTGAGADVNLSYGSYNFFDTSVVGSFGGETAAGLLGYSHKYSDVPESGDGKRLTDIYPAGSPNRYRPDNLDGKAYGIDTFWLKGGSKLGSKAHSDISYAYQDAENVLYPALLMDADYDRTHRVNWTSTLDRPTSIASKLTFQVYVNRVDHLMSDTERISSMPNAKVTENYMMQTDAESTTFGSKLNGDLTLGAGTFSTGIDFYRRNWNAINEMATWKNYAPQSMIPDVDINNYGVFGEYRQPLLTSVTLAGGVRVDYTATEANDLSATRLAALYEPYYNNRLDDENDFTEPSANLQLSWKATDSLEIFSGIASASRTPDQQELYIGLQRMSGKNWIGNPNLDATRNNQLDLGAKWTNETIFISTSVFYSSLTDYITVTNAADPDGDGTMLAAKTYENVDASMWGVEIGSQLALPHDLFVKATLSYVRGENSDTDQPLSEIPPLTGTLSLRYDNGSYFVEVGERMAGRQDKVDTSLNEEETAGFAVTDVKGGVAWKKWDLVGGINNLLDKQYYNYLSYQRDPFQSGEKVAETGLFMYINLRYHF